MFLWRHNPLLKMINLILNYYFNYIQEIARKKKINFTIFVIFY